MRYLPFKVHAWAWEQEYDEPVEKLIMLALSSYSDDHGRSHPSIKTLARAAITSVSTVHRKLVKFESRGMLIRERRSSPEGGQLSNAYWLPVNGPFPPNIHITEEEDFDPDSTQGPPAHRSKGKKFATSSPVAPCDGGYVQCDIPITKPLEPIPSQDGSYPIRGSALRKRVGSVGEGGETTGRHNQLDRACLAAKGRL